MQHNALDFLSRARFKIALRSRLLIDLVLLVVGIVLAFLGGTSVLELIGASTTIVAVVLMATNLFEAWQRNQKTRVVENEEFMDVLTSSALPAGFDLRIGALGAGQDFRSLGVTAARPYAMSDAVNQRLDDARNPIVLESKKYTVPFALQGYRDRCINIRNPNRDDPKIGLRTDVTVDALERNQTFRLQRTDYFSGAATNEMACEQFESASESGSGRASLIFAVSDLVVRNRELLGLSESAMSNHIGVSTLVLTADHNIVIQDQGAQTISANETAVGASGSLDLRDIDETRIAAPTLQGLVRFGMEREAQEELSAAFDIGRKNTVLTGYARYLARGGKPEFFGISRTTSTLSSLKATGAEKRYVSGIWGRPFTPTKEGLLQVIDQLLDEGSTARRRYSLSMVVTLRSARDHIARNGIDL